MSVRTQEAGLGSISELELTSIPIPIPELELQAMELELELQNGIDRNWNGIEDSISIPPSILLTFPYFLLLMAHTDVLKIAGVFFKERICFKISYCILRSAPIIHNKHVNKNAHKVRKNIYRQVSNISRTLVGNKIVDHSDVVGASPVGAAPTTSSFST